MICAIFWTYSYRKFVSIVYLKFTCNGAHLICNPASHTWLASPTLQPGHSLLHGDRNPRTRRLPLSSKLQTDIWKRLAQFWCANKILWFEKARLWCSWGKTYGVPKPQLGGWPESRPETRENTKQISWILERSWKMEQKSGSQEIQRRQVWGLPLRGTLTKEPGGSHLLRFSQGG